MRIFYNLFLVLDLITSFVMDVMLRSIYNSSHLIQVNQVLNCCIIAYKDYCSIEGDVPFKKWSCSHVENFIQELNLLNSEIESSDDEVGNNIRRLQQV